MTKLPRGDGDNPNHQQDPEILFHVGYDHEAERRKRPTIKNRVFGAGTPLTELLLDTVNPWVLAGLLYLGSGVGLTLYRWLRRSPAVRLPTHEAPWVADATIAGSIVNNNIKLIRRELLVINLSGS